MTKEAHPTHTEHGQDGHATHGQDAHTTHGQNAHATAPKATILFIDDDAELVRALSLVIEREGYRVEHATDGDVGVRMASRVRPDLIILDFMMPTKNGFDACCEMRQMPHLKDVPILAFTAFGQDIGEIHGLSRNGKPHVQEYLEKPVEFNILLERISSTLAAAKKAAGHRAPPAST
jgi:two-component system alkaline phosphatase synthesis response regulator PhoP